MFQNITQIVKNKLFFKRMAFSCSKKTINVISRNNFNKKLRTKNKFESHEKYVKIKTFAIL